MISKKTIIVISSALAALIFFGVFYFLNSNNLIARSSVYNLPVWQNLTGKEKEFRKKLVGAAIERVNREVVYDPAYVKIDYPNGDVPENQGVCADVVIRAYRELGIDLQKEVHEDMAKNFDLYPKLWNLKKPDANIDHRRVPNLMVFFERKGQTLPITENLNDYLPGDLVTWSLSRGRTHIGIVIDKLSSDKQRPLIVHNVGAGPKINDALFAWKIIGHFRYSGDDIEMP